MTTVQSCYCLCISNKMSPCMMIHNNLDPYVGHTQASKVQLTSCKYDFQWRYGHNAETCENILLVQPLHVMSTDVRFNCWNMPHYQHSRQACIPFHPWHNLPLQATLIHVRVHPSTRDVPNATTLTKTTPTSGTPAGPRGQLFCFRVLYKTTLC